MAQKIVKLTESQLGDLVKKVLREQELENYMTFSNLQQIRRQADMLLSMDHKMIDKLSKMVTIGLMITSVRQRITWTKFLIFS